MQIILDGAAQPTPRAARKVRFQQRARLAVIAAVAMFVLSQIGMRVFIDRKRPEWRDPAFEIKYRLLEQQMARFDKPTVVLFMGSSITAGGMNAEMCEAPLSSAWQRPVVAFNFGTMCGGPFTQLVYLKRLLRRGVRPDLVVLELSPQFLDFDDAPVDASRFPGYILEHADLPTVSRYNRDDGLEEDWRQAFLVPVYGHRLAILNHVSKSLVPFPDQLDLYRDITPHGWRKRLPATPEEHAQALTWLRQANGPRLAKYRIGQASLQALEEVLALLAEEQIPTLLVRVPEGPLLRSLYPQNARAELERTFRDLSERHQVPLVDCSDWFGEDRFVDSYHMTYIASEELTGRLLEEIGRTRFGVPARAVPISSTPPY